MAENGSDINWSNHQNPLRRGLSNIVRGQLAKQGYRVSANNPSQVEPFKPKSPREKMKETIANLPVKENGQKPNSNGLLTKDDVLAMQKGKEDIIRARAQIAEEARKAKWGDKQPSTKVTNGK